MSVFGHTFNSLQAKLKLSTQFQKIINIPAHDRVKVDRSIETDNIYPLTSN
jgi:hypothetical protein